MATKNIFDNENLDDELVIGNNDILGCFNDDTSDQQNESEKKFSENNLSNHFNNYYELPISSGQNYAQSPVYHDFNLGSPINASAANNFSYQNVPVTYTCAICSEVIYSKDLFISHVNMHKTELSPSKLQEYSNIEDNIQALTSLTQISSPPCGFKQEIDDFTICSSVPQCTVNNTLESKCIDNGNSNIADIYCKQCEISFETQYLLNDHQVRFHGEPPTNAETHGYHALPTDKNEDIDNPNVLNDLDIFTCSLCESAFIGSQALLAHIRKEHASSVSDSFTMGGKMLLCHLCNSSYTFESKFIEHIAHCQKKENSPDNPAEQIQHVSSTTGCESDTLSNIDVQTKYECRKCVLSFGNREEMISHIEDIHSEYTFCYRCNFNFAYRTDFEQHLLIHMNSRDIVCNICSQFFPNITCLRRHCKEVHSTFKILIKQSPDRKNRFNYITCKICFQKCFNEIEIREHVLGHDKQEKFVQNNLKEAKVKSAEHSSEANHIFCVFCETKIPLTRFKTHTNQHMLSLRSASVYQKNIPKKFVNKIYLKNKRLNLSPRKEWLAKIRTLSGISGQSKKVLVKYKSMGKKWKARKKMETKNVIETSEEAGNINTLGSPPVKYKIKRKWVKGKFPPIKIVNFNTKKCMYFRQMLRTIENASAVKLLQRDAIYRTLRIFHEETPVLVLKPCFRIKVTKKGNKKLSSKNNDLNTNVIKKKKKPKKKLSNVAENKVKTKVNCLKIKSNKVQESWIDFSNDLAKMYKMENTPYDDPEKYTAKVDDKKRSITETVSNPLDQRNDICDSNDNFPTYTDNKTDVSMAAPVVKDNDNVSMKKKNQISILNSISSNKNNKNNVFKDQHCISKEINKNEVVGNFSKSNHEVDLQYNECIVSSDREIDLSSLKSSNNVTSHKDTEHQNEVNTNQIETKSKQTDINTELSILNTRITNVDTKRNDINTKQAYVNIEQTNSNIIQSYVNTKVRNNIKTKQPLVNTIKSDVSTKKFNVITKQNNAKTKQRHSKTPKNDKITEQHDENTRQNDHKISTYRIKEKRNSPFNDCSTTNEISHHNSTIIESKTANKSMTSASYLTKLAEQASCALGSISSYLQGTFVESLSKDKQNDTSRIKPTAKSEKLEMITSTLCIESNESISKSDWFTNKRPIPSSTYLKSSISSRRSPQKRFSASPSLNQVKNRSPSKSPKSPNRLTTTTLRSMHDIRATYPSKQQIPCQSNLKKENTSSAVVDHLIARRSSRNWKPTLRFQESVSNGSIRHSSLRLQKQVSQCSLFNPSICITDPSKVDTFVSNSPRTDAIADLTDSRNNTTHLKLLKEDTPKVDPLKVCVSKIIPLEAYSPKIITSNVDSLCSPKADPPGKHTTSPMISKPHEDNCTMKVPSLLTQKAITLNVPKLTKKAITWSRRKVVRKTFTTDGLEQFLNEQTKKSSKRKKKKVRLPGSENRHLSRDLLPVHNPISNPKTDSPALSSSRNDITSFNYVCNTSKRAGVKRYFVITDTDSITDNGITDDLNSVRTRNQLFQDTVFAKLRRTLNSGSNQITRSCPNFSPHKKLLSPHKRNLSPVKTQTDLYRLRRLSLSPKKKSNPLKESISKSPCFINTPQTSYSTDGCQKPSLDKRSPSCKINSKTHNRTLWNGKSHVETDPSKSSVNSFNSVSTSINTATITNFPIKRPRGRPRKSIEKSIHTATITNVPIKRPRERPPKRKYDTANLEQNSSLPNIKADATVNVRNCEIFGKRRRTVSLKLRDSLAELPTIQNTSINSKTCNTPRLPLDISERLHKITKI